MNLYHSDSPPTRSAECVEDGNTPSAATMQHPGPPRKTKNPALHITLAARAADVNPHTMLSTPLVTPEASPVKPSFRTLSSVDDGLGTVREDADEPLSGGVGQQGATSMVSTAATATRSTQTAAKTSIKHYGTRLTTIILVKWNGEVTYVERDVWWQDKRGAVHNGGTGDRVFHLHL
ncbi:hypothetical protein QFC24_001073 [Naganishia onofrii]|uniref:Uncharacterized protein n=1 Tax=Naganishia onofrii TaxID=1851511 RepID=A0ACC2XUV4_9TREE|nr:hypothetical protein QFC24_001073 [Naganishia onofrii]